MAGLVRPVRRGRVTQRFGATSLSVEPRGWFVERDDRGAVRAAAGDFAGGQAVRRVHPGIDIGLAEGTHLRAVEAGEIIARGTFESTGELYVTLRIRPGVTAFYTHLKDFRCSKGDIVRRGQVIGLSGDSGISTGPHLHFEIRRKLGGRKFRYNPRRLFEGRDMADESWILPPGSAPPPPPPSPFLEDDMPPLLEDRLGQLATIRSAAEVHAVPSLAAGTLIRVVTDVERPMVVGLVEGDQLAGSAKWLMWVANGRFEYTHASNVDSFVEPGLEDCSEDVSRAVAAFTNVPPEEAAGELEPEPEADDAEPAHDLF